MINFFDIISNLIMTFFEFLKYPLLFFCVVILILVFITCSFLAYFMLKGKRFKKRTVLSNYKKRGKFKRIFVDFPRRVSLDLLNANPDKFGEHGVIIFTGRQGRGKTVAMAQQLLDYQDKYPLCKVTTNFNYKYQDKVLNHWRVLTDYNNGESGVVAAIDETQNWFSSNQSRNFPPEMLSVITQNRKNKRIILGTAQNFYLLAKALRSQCTEVRECYTVMRCLTIVRRREPVLDVSGEVVKYNNKGFYFFVHSDKLRNCYDTYKVIENLKKSGFQKRSEVSVSVSTE